MFRRATTPVRRARRLPEEPTKRHPVPHGPDPDTVLLVLRRATRDAVVCCEVCGSPLDGERSLDWSVHHRRGRMGARTDHSPPNLLVVCGADNRAGCHGRVHQRRSEAQPAGWWISRNAPVRGVLPDPATVPVLIGHGSRWVYLTAGGGYADNPPPGGTP